MNDRRPFNRLHSDSDDNKYPGISRREFMAQMSMLAALVSVYPAGSLAEKRQSDVQVNVQPDKADAAAEWTDDPRWQTIIQVQEVLFPAADDVPGANEFGAHIYLHNALENPGADAEDKDFIFRGVGWLDDLTQQEYKKTFRQLNAGQQQQTITRIVKSRAGRNWVSTLLSYLLEALLADPVYGGNRNGIGWQWLQHQPGYPSPPLAKTWDRLLQRRYRA
jgi:gluconate 2-dehydrogenase gamma chain